MKKQLSQKEIDELKKKTAQKSKQKIVQK